MRLIHRETSTQTTLEGGLAAGLTACGAVFVVGRFVGHDGYDSVVQAWQREGVFAVPLSELVTCPACRRGA